METVSNTRNEGELYIGGSPVFVGYLNREDLTSLVLLDLPHIYSHGPLYKTGDLVRYNDRMELVFVGRVDFQVKLRGQRLEVGEIESCIQSYRDDIRGIQVQQCIVQKIVDENTRNEYLCAYFTIKSEKDEQEQERL